MRLQSRIHLALLLGIFLLAGCGGGTAEFSGSIKGQAFNPTGTVFAYMDTAKSGTARPLVIVATWVSVDPLRSFDDYGSEHKLALQKEFANKDALVFAFLDSGNAKIGTTYLTNANLQGWLGLDANKGDAHEPSQLNNSRQAQLNLRVILSKLDLSSAYPMVEGELCFFFGTELVRATFSTPIYVQDADLKKAKATLLALAEKSSFANERPLLAQ